MQVKCEYCESFIDDTLEKCPCCGAVNKNHMRQAVAEPKTIEQLLEYAKAHKLPLQDMRFFIGQDYKGARAFGIYKDDSGNFVVYKNKADGTRSIRYSGRDEAYAVNELYQKIRSEVSNQKMYQAQKRESANRTNGTQHRRQSKAVLVAACIIIGLQLLIVIFAQLGPQQGYYNYLGRDYYYFDNDWYGYDDDTGWSDVNAPSELNDNYSDYEVMFPDSGTSSFESSDYYYESRSSDWNSDSWDSGDSWDYSDSWDSGSTDWDSDW